jgi:hypothetical protein
MVFPVLSILSPVNDYDNGIEPATTEAKRPRAKNAKAASGRPFASFQSGVS